MFKTALFDCAIREKCCSGDGGRNLPSKVTKNANAWGSVRGGAPWAQLELPDG